MDNEYYYGDPCPRCDSMGCPCILDYFHRGPCEYLPLPDTLMDTL